MCVYIYIHIRSDYYKCRFSFSNAMNKGSGRALKICYPKVLVVLDFVFGLCVDLCWVGQRTENTI